MTLLNEIINWPGYSIKQQMSSNDLRIVRGIIFDQFYSRISKFSSEMANSFLTAEMDEYHSILKKFPNIDHAQLWPKKERIIPKISLSKFKSLDFFKAIEKSLGGSLDISNEEGLLDEEVYWRIVRPPSDGGNNDVGPLHADEWFWSLGHGKMPPKKKRIKVWISVFTQNGASGFKCVPNSHLENWNYKPILKDGILKPRIEVDESRLTILPFDCNPGQMIIFNDKLLHGGFVGGSKTRVSIECTLLVNESSYKV